MDSALACFNRVDQLTHQFRGPKYLSALVLCLTRSLGVRYALVAERHDVAGEQAAALAFADGENSQQPFIYTTSKIPCGQVLQGSEVSLSCEVRLLFPEADVEAYCGQPLRNPQGEVIGILAIEHTEPLADADTVAAVLKRLAGRVAAEVECERLRRGK